MRTVILASLIALLPMIAHADNPEWAYPPAPPADLPKPDPNQVVKVPGSDKEYKESEVNNAFGPPDWFPSEHAAMPKVVASGNRPDPRACALCHLPTGDGHPESAGVSGLNANYIVRQLNEFKEGRRTGIRTGAMVGIAKAITPEDAKAAAEYFAARKPSAGYTKVVESAMVPKSYVGEGSMRFAVKGGGDEPIGARIIELPQDEPGARARNPKTGFVAHVPPGTLAKGQALATTGGGKTLPCAICHGPGLKGLGEVPAIANRSPMYLYRQLNDIKSGARKGPSVALMEQVVAKLEPEDILNLAAYVGSLEP